jgi:hypothetical protein
MKFFLLKTQHQHGIERWLTISITADSNLTISTQIILKLTKELLIYAFVLSIVLMTIE